MRSGGVRLDVIGWNAFGQPLLYRGGDLLGIAQEAEANDGANLPYDLDREIERFRLFESQGLTEISLRLHDAPMEALKIIGEKVVPALR